MTERMYTADEVDAMIARAVAGAQPAPVQEHDGCACRWSSEGDRTVTCERHQGWLEVIAEWADRAREAEAKLKATPPAAQRQWVGLTKTVVGNHLRRHALGDQSTFRQGFKEGVAFAELKLKEKNT
jgi:hypothetical protein